MTGEPPVMLTLPSDQALDRKHSNEQQHDEGEDREAHLAARAAERLPHFFVEVKPIGLRFSDHDSVAQAAEREAVSHVHIVQALGQRGGNGPGVPEMPDEFPLLAQDRYHKQILPQGD